MVIDVSHWPSMCRIGVDSCIQLAIFIFEGRNDIAPGHELAALYCTVDEVVEARAHAWHVERDRGALLACVARTSSRHCPCALPRRVDSHAASCRRLRGDRVGASHLTPSS